MKVEMYFLLLVILTATVMNCGQGKKKQTDFYSCNQRNSRNQHCPSANFQILLFIQKYVHHRNKLPAVFPSYFEENKLLHCHDTRQTKRLPDDLKNTTSLLSFKYELKSYLLHTLQQ